MAANPEAKSALLGDPTRWVDRYGDALLRFALSRISQPEIAEDLVQETFLAAWQARQSYDGRAAFGTWLCSILRRKIADHFRQCGRQANMTEEEGTTGEPFFKASGKWLDVIAPWKESPEEVFQRTEFWAIFTACLATLPGHLAEAFHLRELRQATVEETSVALGISPKNLSVRLHRARLSLRRCLDQRWFRNSA